MAQALASRHYVRVEARWCLSRSSSRAGGSDRIISPCRGLVAVLVVAFLSGCSSDTTDDGEDAAFRPAMELDRPTCKMLTSRVQLDWKVGETSFGFPGGLEEPSAEEYREFESDLERLGFAELETRIAGGVPRTVLRTDHGDVEIDEAIRRVQDAVASSRECEPPPDQAAPPQLSTVIEGTTDEGSTDAAADRLEAPPTTSTTTTTSAPWQPDHGQAMRGRSYRSTEVTEGGAPRPMNEDATISLGFREHAGGDFLGWSIRCNIDGAPVEILADRLVTGEIAGTQVGCPPEDQADDEWFAWFIHADPKWALDGQRLTLWSDDTRIELIECVDEC